MSRGSRRRATPPRRRTAVRHRHNGAVPITHNEAMPITHNAAMPTTPELQLTDPIPTRWESLDDDRFSIGGDRMVQRLFTGGHWLEGPAYFAAGRYLVFSDIPEDRILRWDEVTGSVGVFRHPAG